ALRPVVVEGKRARRVGRLLVLALVNPRRLPARTLLGVGGLALGIAGLTVLLAIQRSFRATLVGTLLGNPLAVQVRPVALGALLASLVPLSQIRRLTPPEVLAAE